MNPVGSNMNGQHMAMKSVSKLPAEILDAIISQLNQCDVVSCSRVNKFWARICVHRINKHAKISGRSFRSLFVNDCRYKLDLPSVRTLHLIGSQRLRDLDLFLPFMSIRRQLTGVTVELCVGPYTKQLPSFLSNCYNLTRLTLIRCDATDAGLIALAQAQPPLMSLELTRVLATKEGVLTLLSSCRKTLKYLKIAGWGLRVGSYDRILVAMLQLPKAEAIGFWLGFCDWKTLAIPAHYVNMNIKSVEIEGEESFSDPYFISQLSAIIPNTKHWRLFNCDLRDEALVSILNHSNNIRSLILETTQHPSSLSVSSLQHILHLKHLKSITLSRCDRVEDKYLIRLASQIPSVSKLDLQGCLHVTDVGITNASLLLPNLEVLNISFCHEISDVSIHALSKNNHCLRSLSAISCHAISPQALSVLLTNAPYLINIEVCHNDYPSFTALRQIIHSSYHLCLTPKTSHDSTQRGRMRNMNHGTTKCPKISRVDLEVLCCRYPRLRSSTIGREEEKWYNDLVCRYIRLNDGGKSHRSAFDVLAEEIANISVHLLA